MRLVSPALLVAALLAAAPALASDSIDTRVTFAVGDDDVARGPTETASGSPSLPSLRLSNRNRAFFDDYERRDNGFENLSYFAIYANTPGFFEGVTTEAALVLRAEIRSEFADARIREDGSYIQISKALGDDKLVLTAFPISANRFQLGYSYDIAWGGSAVFGINRVSAVPGLRLQYETPSGYSFLGFKGAVTQVVQPDNTLQEDTVFGVLAGAGIDIADEYRFEGGLGYFDRGTIDKEELRILEDGKYKVAPWQAFGASAQASWHVGMPIGQPIDFRLYKNDPLKRESFFKREQYNDEVSFVVQTEASYLGQTLQDPEAPSSTLIQPAFAGDLSGRVKVGKLRLHALAVYRTLSYILFNVPSLSFTDFPAGVTNGGEFFANIGFDYFLEGAELTPGFVIGVQRPAFTTSSGRSGREQQTVVFLDEVLTNILPAGEAVKLAVDAKITGRWNLSEILAVVGEVLYKYNPNATRFEPALDGIPVRVRDEPNVVGFNVMMQARF